MHLPLELEGMHECQKTHIGYPVAWPEHIREELNAACYSMVIKQENECLTWRRSRKQETQMTTPQAQEVIVLEGTTSRAPCRKQKGDLKKTQKAQVTTPIESIESQTAKGDLLYADETC